MDCAPKNIYSFWIKLFQFLHFRSSIDRPLNPLPPYPCSNNYFSIPEENIWSIIGGLWKKNYFGWSGVYFISILHLYITVTCWHTMVFYGKDCFSNIKTSSKRLEYLNIFPSFFKKGLGAIRAKIGPTSDVDKIFSKMY